MHISQSNLMLSSAHRAFSYAGQSATAKVTVRRPHPENVAASAPKPDTGAGAESALPPALALLKLLIEKLTGQKIDLVDPASLRPPAGDERAASSPPASRAQPQVSVEIDAQSIRYEAETSSFAARGTVTTSDGRQITLDLQASISREYFEKDTLSLRAGPAASKDPLVLDLSGAPTQLSPQKVSFDINADGVVEQIAMPGAGSALLALDRNGNGTVDDGSELFGPQSGNGYADLAALDSDHNGWIDEADGAFSQLRLWQPASDGGTLETLAQAGVGAISLQNVATPFSFRDPTTNTELGRLQSSGVFLREDGTAGTVRQIDVVA